MPSKLLIENGTRFGRLTVQGLADYRLNRGRVYHCLCDCGQLCDIRAVSLKNGDTKSCGCLAKELSSERNKNAFIKDNTGKRFGKLTAIRPTDERKNNSVVWECRCDCGATIFVSNHNLVNGTASCGCLKSKGEMQIAQLLTNAGIAFQQEYTFPDLISEKGYPLRYDFYVDNTYLIEFDGEQHIRDISMFSHDNFEYRQQNDKKKTEYAQQHSIPLIRIPYTKLATLSIDDITL